MPRSLLDLDFGDPVHRALLRSRIVAAACALGALTTAVTSVSSWVMDRTVTPVQVVGFVFTVALGATFAVLGPRIGDRWCTVTLVAGHVACVASAVDVDARVEISRTAILLMIGTTLAALLLEAWQWVVVQLAVAASILVGLAFVEMPQGAVPDTATSVLALLVVTSSLRLMRDRALRAVDEARRSAITDPLTGLANRRGMELFATRRWQGTQPPGNVIALAVDVDHFKEVNDTLGHAGGDDVLRRLAAVLSSCVRPGDVAVRMGGEEFLVLVTGRPGEGIAIGERIRVAVAEQLAPITVSVGVHEVAPDEAGLITDQLWAAADAADHALYEAKRSGRNRVVMTGGR